MGLRCSKSVNNFKSMPIECYSTISGKRANLDARQHRRTPIPLRMRRKNISSIKLVIGQTSPFTPNPAFQAIDTCLCKILAEQNETDELVEILAGTNACLVSELEGFINVDVQPGLLARIMLILGENARVLEIIASSVSVSSAYRHGLKDFFTKQYGG